MVACIDLKTNIDFIGINASEGPMIQSVLVLPVAGLLQKWKSEYPLLAVLLGKADGRTGEGLNRALERAEEQCHAEAEALRNYKKKVEVAKSLKKGNYGAYKDSELDKMVASIEDEGVTLPLNITSKLLEKHLDKLLQIGAYQDVLHASNPFATREWDRAAPCLGALCSGEQDKLATFEDVYLQNCLKPLLAEGSFKVQQVQAFCEAAASMMDAIDPFDLSAAGAQTRHSASTIFHAILALSVDEIVVEKQDCGGGIHTHPFNYKLDSDECHQRTDLGGHLFEMILGMGWEAVETLHAALGKTHTSPVVIAAAMLEATEFWHFKLQSYIEDLPAQLEVNSQTEQIFQENFQDDMSAEWVEQAMPFFKMLPTWTPKLRKGALAKLEGLIHEKLQYLLDKAMHKNTDNLEPGQPPAHDAWRWMQKLLGEVSIAMPLSKTINEMQTQVGDKLAASEQEMMQNSLHQLCTDSLAQPCGHNLWLNLQEQLVKLQALLQPSDDLQKGMIKSLDHVLSLMGGFLTAPLAADASKEVMVLVDWLSSLAKHINMKELVPLSHAFQSAFDIHFHHTERHEGHASLQDLQTLRAMHIELKKALDDVKKACPGCDKKLFLDALDNKVKDIDTMMLKELQWWKQEHMQRVKVACGSVDKLLEKVDKWTKSCAGTKTLQSLQTLAKSSLLTVKPQEWQTEKQKTHEAISERNIGATNCPKHHSKCMYPQKMRSTYSKNLKPNGLNTENAWVACCKVFEILGEEQDQALKCLVDKKVELAVVCMNVGCIVYTIGSVSEKAKLRESIRKIVKDMRESLGKDSEKTHLPEILLGEVNKIMQCKSSSKA
eukprot:6492134-Amphidinium_carterae.1